MAPERGRPGDGPADHDAREKPNGTAPLEPSRSAYLPAEITRTATLAHRRRRAAALRLPPIGDGPSDPFDDLAGPVAAASRSSGDKWGTYDVTTLGLDCAHGDGCAARAEAV